MANIVEFKNVSMSFGNNHVLKNIDLEIEKGKFYTLLGPSVPKIAENNPQSNATTIVLITITIIRVFSNKST